MSRCLVVQVSEFWFNLHYKGKGCDELNCRTDGSGARSLRKKNSRNGSQFWFILVIAGIKVHSNTLPFFGTLETGRLLDFNKIQPWPCYLQQKLNRAARIFLTTIWFTLYCYHSWVFRFHSTQDSLAFAILFSEFSPKYFHLKSGMQNLLWVLPQHNLRDLKFYFFLKTL